MSSISHTSSAAQPADIISQSSNASQWRWLWAVFVGLLATAIFFRSVLPRLPRILFRGKLRIKRAGLRGVRGIEYRSKGFHNDSAAFSRNENQLEVKIQRIYASFHLPYFLCRAKDQPSVVPRKNGAVVTIHVSGVGVRLPRNQHDKSSKSPTATPDSEDSSTDSMTVEQREERRLQQLMSSPPMSPSAELYRPFSETRPQPQLQRAASSEQRRWNQHDDSERSALYRTCHQAGTVSLRSMFGLATWLQCSAAPRLKSVILRALRAALYLLTSGLPMLTSLVSIEIDRIEVYIQEVEAVARIGRAAITFSMAPDSLSPEACPPKASHDRKAQNADRTSYYLRAPSWTQFSQAMRMMPTKVGSGARGAANYLVAGMSPSTVSIRLRLDSIDVFEATFKPAVDRITPHSPPSRRTRGVPPSTPSTPSASRACADPGVMSPSQSDVNLHTVSADTSVADDSFEWSSRPTRPKRQRSNSASRLSKMSTGSLRGYVDRWADWALEPLVDSDFHAESGWTRQLLDKGFSSHQLQTIPSTARIVCISGLTDLTANLLVGSNLALGGDGTLASRLVLGNISVGLDAAHRIMCVLEERKARRTGLAPTQHGLDNDQRSVLSKHLVQQRPSASASALRMVSSVSLSLPSISVTASSDAMLSSDETCQAGEAGQSDKSLSLPSRQLAISLTGFHFELSHSDPAHHLHRRWLGTCGISAKSAPGKESRGRSKDSPVKSRTREGKGARSRRIKLVEHRRVFVAEVGLASFEVHCRADARDQGSRLLFVGDISITARSAWTPFGLFPASDEFSRLLIAGDPNEHAAAIEASVGGVETDIPMHEVAALIPIAKEFKRRRQNKRKSIDIDDPPPKTDLGRLRRLPRISAGVHVQRISLILSASASASREEEQETKGKHENHSSSRTRMNSRKLTLSVPNFDFVFFGEYRDEYVKRPVAEKRAAYKALKNDGLEWPISGRSACSVGGRSAETRRHIEHGPPSKGFDDPLAAPTQDTQASSERYTEMNLTMEETIARMQELQQKQAGKDRPPFTLRRPSLREPASGYGKARLPGYSRRSSMAAETRFNIRYQFETCLRVDAVESFLSLESESRDPPRRFGADSGDGSSQHHLLAMHSFEVHGSGRIPGNLDPRASALDYDVPRLSAQDAVAEIRASIEDVDIEAWQACALDAYADIATSILQAKQDWNASHQLDQTDNSKQSDQGQDDVRDDKKPAKEPQSFVERLPGGLALYLSVGHTIAHLGGLDHHVKDNIARGVGFEAERIVIEYAAVTETKTNLSAQKSNWGARTALELSEDLQLQAISLASRHGRVGLARVGLHEVGIFPILDAALATQQHTEGTASESFARAKAPKGEAFRDESFENGESDHPATSLLADSVWAFNNDGKHVHKSKQHRPRLRQQDRSNFIFFMPVAAFKAIVRPPQAEVKSSLAGTIQDEVSVTSENTDLLAFKIDLLHTYCLLLAFSTFKNLAARAKSSVRTAAPSTEHGATGKQPGTAVKHRRPSVSCHVTIKEVHSFVTLPRSVRIFMRMRRLEVRQDPRAGLSVSTETIMGAVESPKQDNGDLWEEAVRLRDWKVTVPPKVPEKKLQVQVSGDAALIRIPYGYAVNPIIDNTSVAFKATKQLVYQFLSENDDAIIVPCAEDPKMLPDIQVHLRVLTLEAQDDPFETRLNLIWRAGFAENAARLEREAAFAAKLEAIAASKVAHSAASFRSRRSDDSIAPSIASVQSDLDDDSSRISHDTRFTEPQEQHISYEEARIALNAFNSSSWVRRYTNAQTEQKRRQEAVLKSIYGRFPMSRSMDHLPVTVLPIGKEAPLFRSTMYRLSLDVGQASFPIDQLRDFIHDKGDGIPKDTPFSLLIPMHMKWEMEEWRITLRDYPLPLLHVPPTHRSETDARKAWCFAGDVVIAEQLGGPESIRHVPAVIVPAATGRPDAIEYGIVVHKVAMPVKMYGAPTVHLKTPFPTRMVWGQSLQPAIQDVMRVIDGLTPPPHDPSPKLGVWDKLPLILHGNINFKFQDEGGFNIHMKGSRDPYSIQGEAAGWVKSWKGGVELRIGYDNPEREFFQILSHEYVLAVPDLCDYVDNAATGVLGGGDQHASRHQQDRDGEDSFHDSHDRKSTDASFTSSMYRYMKDPTFRKIVIKLTNGVRWGAGLHGERTCDDETCPRRPKCKGEPFYRECRNFERIDHWKVITKTREHFASLPESERRDSYRGWRSHHIHLSMSVYSPKNGLPGYGGDKVSKLDAVNNFYFSPLAWQHFFAWMRLFNHAMGLPIRIGKLFPDSPPPSPKFGRFLGTIKYRLDLAPLFITHQYRQFSKEDWARGFRTHVGIKARIDSFCLDMHQRQQETIKDRPELGGPRIVFHKPFYEAEVSCETINLKTIAARLRDDSEISAAAMDEQEVGENVFDDLFAEDVVVPDEELDWIDMNDLVELDSQRITDPSPKIRMFPAMLCPQFNYYRKVDSKRERRAREMQDRATKGDDSSLGGTDVEELLGRLERSKFGSEDTHGCMVGKNDKPYGAQRKLAQERLHTIRREIDRILASGDGASATSEGDSDGSGDQQDQLNDLHGRERILSGFISHLGRLQEHLDRVDRAKAEGQPLPTRSGTIDRNFSFDAGDLTSLYHDLGTFDNRYVAHNPILFFSNVTRTLLLKYYYSSRLRRGYAHHMTATAVRYIRDLLKKKDKRESKSENARRRDRGRTPQHLTPTAEDGNGLDILHEMLEDTVNHVFGKDADSKSGRNGHPEEEKFKNLDEGMRPTDGISDEFNVEKSNVCLLLKPQVVLRSDIDDKSTVILTALRTRLQNYTVQDESCADDSVNAVVLRRNFFGLDNLQCYHPTPRSKPDRLAHDHARQHGFVSLPLETLADMHGHSRDFERIVPHTNASMYYDKFNKLRLSDSSRSVATFRKNGKPVMDHLHHHMDMILLNCPRFSVSANSEHFAALYNVVTDLILYRDPAHRDHAKRLEEMMFSYDFTDVAGLADIVTALQVRIRDAQSLVDQYRAVADRLNDQGKADFLALLGELLDLVIELNLIMDAITTSQDSKGGADREKKSALRFMTQAQEVAWNMLGDEAGQLVAKLALRGISFSWLNKADNSAANTLSIQDLQALNVDPDAMFAEIITKHLRAPDHPMAKEGRFLDAMWSVLPPVGGISIVDMFEFNLHPVKIQIELVVGRKIMDYIFGTKRQREKEEEEQKRIEDDARRQGTVATKKKSPFARLLGGRKQSGADPSSTSSQTSRRPGTNDNLSNLSTTDARSRSASSSDLLSVGRPSSDASRDDDAESVSGKAATKAVAPSSSTAKTSPKSRPASPSNGKQDTDTDRPSDQYAIAQKQAAEMRARASAYRTFVYVKISETVFSLSYKGEKQKSITDLYDLVFRTPNFEYHNSTFGYVDLADNFKKDVFKAAWNQKSTLLRDIITHRPNRKRNAIESIRAIRQASRARESLAPLDISVDPPTPTDQSSFDGSSYVVESPTDTFSYRVGEGSDEAEIVDSPESGTGPHAENHSDDSDDAEDEPAGQYHHTRTSTGQTLAGQIRDAWGRNNAVSKNDSASANSDEPRHSTSEVEDSLADEVTPLGEAPGSDNAWRFPTLTRSHNSDTETPTNERRGPSTSPSPSPHLQLPSMASPVSHARRSSPSARSNSPSSFKLNKLIPKKLRPRATSSTASTSARNSLSERHASPAPSSPLHDHSAGQGEAEHHLGADTERVRSRAASTDYSASTASHQ